MRLLVVVNVFEPDLGGGVLFSDLCYGLAERGFDVTVRCAYPYYPEWRDKSGENGLEIRTSVTNGVRVERFGIYIPKDPNSFRERLLYESSFTASLMRAVPRPRQFDAIMVFCPLMGAVAYAAFCKRIIRAPLWLNVQDLPAEAASSGGIGGGRAARAMIRVEDALFNQADIWSTISPAMAETLRPKRRKDQPLLYIQNWLHRSLAEALRSASGEPSAPSSSQPAATLPRSSLPPKLLYSGNIGTKQNLIEFCRVLHASDAAFEFLIQGEGSEAGTLRAWLSEASDPRFDMRGLSDEAELARALREADFVVITERGDSGGAFIPSKLIPALAAGTPVLAVCDRESPLGREMSEYDLGPQFEWADVGQVPLFLASLDTQRYSAWQAAALARAKFYDRARVLDLYARELGRLGG